MRDLQWSDEFDIALCWGGSFGYFDDRGNDRFLRKVYEALKPGGVFLLDTHIAETLLPMFKKRDWNRVTEGEILLLEDRSYDHLTSRVDCEWTLIKGEKSIGRGAPCVSTPTKSSHPC